MNTIIAKYECKILPLGLLKTVAFAVSFSMSVLFILILIGTPFWLTGMLFFGVMYGILYYLSNNATFILSETHLERLQPRKPPYFTSVLEQKYDWNDIKSYKNGIEMGRYRGEFQFLEITFKDGVSWSLTDVYGEKRLEFDQFLSYFQSKVNEINKVEISDYQIKESATQSTAIHQKNKPVIVRKKTFYETIWAKIFTALMIVFVVGIVLFYIFNPHYLRVTAGFKVLVVLIPGVLYLTSRVFMGNKNDQ